MKRALIIGFVVILGGAAGWYLLSPIFRVVEVDEPFPGEEATTNPTASPTPSPVPIPVVNDALDAMTPERRAEFNAAVEAMREKVLPMADTMPKPLSGSVQVLARGLFQPRAHEVAGGALLVASDGKKTLRFEDFETLNGPNLHIYLAADLGADDFVDLGQIRATKGNVNYELDASVDTAKYNKVLVWCVPFRVLFSYAELQ